MADLHLNLNHQPLDLKVAQFKNDEEKVAEVNAFLNDIFEKAQKEVEHRRNGKNEKNKLMDQRKSVLGQTVLNRLPEFLHPEFLPQYAIVPIQCGVLLLLATIIIKKFLWSSVAETS